MEFGEVQRNEERLFILLLFSKEAANVSYS